MHKNANYYSYAHRKTCLAAHLAAEGFPFRSTICLLAYIRVVLLARPVLIVSDLSQLGF